MNCLALMMGGDTLFDANNTRDYVLDSLADYIDRGEAQERAAARSLIIGGR